MFWEFLLIFSFKPLSCLVQATKALKNVIGAILGYRSQSKFYAALRQVKKQHFKVKFWNWGPLTIWPYLTSARFKNNSTQLHTLQKHKNLGHQPQKLNFGLLLISRLVKVEGKAYQLSRLGIFH